MEGIIFGILQYYSRLLTTPTFKGNHKMFKLFAVCARFELVRFELLRVDCIRVFWGLGNLKLSCLAQSVEC